jgi:hypothetical protein
MIAAVTPLARTPAEHSVLQLQQAADSGVPVMIPGAWNVRTAPSVPPPIAMRTTVQTPFVPERERLEREGGGSPSERRGAGWTSFLGRLWRTTLHPSEIGVIWSRAVPLSR